MAADALMKEATLGMFSDSFRRRLMAVEGTFTGCF